MVWAPWVGVVLFFLAVASAYDLFLAEILSTETSEHWLRVRDLWGAWSPWGWAVIALLVLLAASLRRAHVELEVRDRALHQYRTVPIPNLHLDLLDGRIINHHDDPLYQSQMIRLRIANDDGARKVSIARDVYATVVFSDENTGAVLGEV